MINDPDSTGLACNLVQHMIELPAYNYVSFPNLPFFDGLPSNCDSTINESLTPSEEDWVTVFPNPANEYLYFSFFDQQAEYLVELSSITAQIVVQKKLQGPGTFMVVANYPPGLYLLKITNACCQEIFYQKILLF